MRFSFEIPVARVAIGITPARTPADRRPVLRTRPRVVSLVVLLAAFFFSWSAQPLLKMSVGTVLFAVVTILANWGTTVLYLRGVR